MLAGALVVLGACICARARIGKGPPVIDVPLIGPLSAISIFVLGLVPVWLGYHLGVYTLGLTQFRAPVPIVWIVAGLAIIGTLLADAIDRDRGKE